MNNKEDLVMDEVIEVDYSKREVGRAKFKDEYPINLLEKLDINSYSEKKIDYNSLSEDQLLGLDYAINCLKENEKMILLLRFKEKMTYSQIAKEYLRSETRMQQIIGKSIRKLLHPSRKLFIIEGYTERLKQLNNR